MTPRVRFGTYPCTYASFDVQTSDAVSEMNVTVKATGAGDKTRRKGLDNLDYVPPGKLVIHLFC